MPAHRTTERSGSKTKSWTRFSDERLGRLRLQELELTPEQGLIGECLVALHGELERAGIPFKPHVWLSDEWFCPDGVPGFAAPFFLTHPRLMRWERREMLELEGGTRRRCLRLMRHETGHAIDNAFGLRHHPRRRTVFGSSERAYPRSYYPKLFSRQFVRYLEFGYAQAHPDEDFAETFAVWLDPKSRWKTRYRGWPARRKLDHVDSVLQSIRGQRPKLRNRKRVSDISTLSSPLVEHYRRKREKFKIDDAQVFDDDLTSIFSTGSRGAPAEKTLQRLRPRLRRRVAKWTGLKHYTVDQLILLWTQRCRDLKLRGADKGVELELSTALAARVTLYVKARQHRLIL